MTPEERAALAERLLSTVDQLINIHKDDVDYKAWVLDLCSLLDEIEANKDNAEKLDALLSFRFQIIRKHGMTVKIVGAGEVGHG